LMVLILALLALSLSTTKPARVHTPDCRSRCWYFAFTRSAASV
jgi:coproporphyrinogen III oxidase-like Fe-S oxidoreductase